MAARNWKVGIILMVKARARAKARARRKVRGYDDMMQLILP